MLALRMLFFLYFIAQISGSKVTELPGLPKFAKLNVAHTQYSGYAQTSESHFLHYWFVSAERDPSTKPIILWMNGGPGCSSLVGYLAEMGPFLVNKDGKTLSANPWAWNKFANMIYLEAPAGVGYSYSTDGNLTTDDDQTSLENYKALKLILKKVAELVPEFRKLDFYIAGQSYGGIYAPTLAKRVIDGMKEFPLNFKGVLIGNGILDGNLILNTFFKYANFHGLLTDNDDSDFVKHDDDDLCTAEFYKLWQRLLNEGINVYDINADCFHIANITDESVRLKKLRGRIFLGSYHQCWDDRVIKGYLSQKSVRKALHIPDIAPKWDTCLDWPLGQEYKETYYWVSREEIIKEIIKFGAKVLLYYGDADLACTFMHAEQFANHLKLQLIEDKMPWYYNGQNAGFKTRYRGLDMYTIKGAGHMAPADRRPQTFHLVQQFTTGKN